MVYSFFFSFLFFLSTQSIDQNTLLAIKLTLFLSFFSFFFLMNKKFYSNKWEKDDKNKTKTHSYAANSTRRTPAQPKREKQTSETTSLQLRNIERKTESGNLQKLLKTVFCFFFWDNSIVTISGVGGIWTLVLFIEETGNASYNALGYSKVKTVLNWSF